MIANRYGPHSPPSLRHQLHSRLVQSEPRQRSRPLLTHRLPHHQRLRLDRGWAMDEGDRHFQKDNEVFKAEIDKLNAPAEQPGPVDTKTQ